MSSFDKTFSVNQNLFFKLINQSTSYFYHDWHAVNANFVTVLYQNLMANKLSHNVIEIEIVKVQYKYLSEHIYATNHDYNVARIFCMSCKM